jgi:predicted RNase H-like nuclease
LNANKPLPSKKSEEGDCLRRKLLKGSGFREVDRWLTKTRIGTGAKRDDVLDACAVALAARELAGSVGSPQPDTYGLPMQIWF